MVDSDNFIIYEDMDQIIIPENENTIYEYKIESLEPNDLFLFIYKINDDESKEILCNIEKIHDDKLFLNDTNSSKTYSILLNGENTLILKTEDMASTAPAAPNRWPVIDFVELIFMSYKCFPNTSLRALVSATSPRGVDVPCILIASTSVIPTPHQQYNFP